MEYTSIINYYVLTGRGIFILVCFFFLGCCVNIFPFFTNNAFLDSLPGRIIGGLGMSWGIITTTRAIYFRTKTISIKDDHITINEFFKRKRNSYLIKDIRKIKEGDSYDYGRDASVNTNAIKIVFKNGDSYKFVYYDYLNSKKLSKLLRSVKKIEDVSFIIN